MTVKKLITLIPIIIIATGIRIVAQTPDTGTSVSYNVNIMDYGRNSSDAVPMQISVSRYAVEHIHGAGQRFQFGHTLSYTHHDKGFQGYFDTVDDAETFLHGHMYTYRINARYAISDQWAVRGAFSPQIRSYLEKHDRSFYTDYQGGVMMEYTNGGNWTFGGGYAYSRNLSKGLVHPVVFVQYDYRTTFRTTLYFPEKAEIWFTPGSRFGAGLVATLDGDEFRGKESTYGRDNTSIQYADFTIGPAAEFRITGHITFRLKAAYTAGRHLVIEADEFREKLDPSPSMSIDAGIRFQLP